MVNRQDDHWPKPTMFCTVTVVSVGLWWTDKTTTDRNLPRCVRLRWFVLNREKEEMTLLRSQVGPAVILQGVFTLQIGDTLWVDVTAGKLDTSCKKSSYVGLYLIRTWWRCRRLDQLHLRWSVPHQDLMTLSVLGLGLPALVCTLFLGGACVSSATQPGQTTIPSCSIRCDTSGVNKHS